DAWGNLTGSTGSATTSFMYAGAYYDSSTGLYYMQARYYDPLTGQFLSLDPDVAQTMAPFNYAGNNPVNANDPSGLSPGAPPIGECAQVGGTWINNPSPADAQSLWFGHCLRPTHYTSIVSWEGALHAVHVASELVTVVAGGCALIAGLSIVGNAGVSEVCGAVALGASAVQALSGAALYGTGHESAGQFVGDIASFGLGGLGYGLSAASTYLRETSEAWQVMADNSGFFRAAYYSLKSGFWGAGADLSKFGAYSIGSPLVAWSAWSLGDEAYGSLLSC
ncbi:MAG TPA: RHS repeat-associated core domain-containing protein, partial [Acidimicrobiales bacterium]|nr:RHS repeat-associated core domain-containing protein [Acidimicrobiales bacterium]